ncbi:MAG: tandem-95 repeat protein [Pyrinomonadaceae bacterium]|nr:tandem-95 repeat protein [Sphingobacteriaceae bacterium]
MLKKINALVFFLLCCGTAELWAQFPYFESFKNSTATDVVFGPQANPAYLTSGQTDPINGITDPVGDGYLRLTRNTTNQTGFIHNKTSFSSQFGLKIDFEFFTHGGGAFGVSADGITFFLYDAAVTDANFKIGGFGGSLGYAQYQPGSVGAVAEGVSGAYLGIGIDEYGNFSNPVEGRQGGSIPGTEPDGRSPNSITLRGKGNGNALTPDNYKYLTSKLTNDPLLPPEDRFDIRTSQRRPDSTHSEYRKVIIDLQPAVFPATGYFITVKIKIGGTPTKTRTLINNHYYSQPAPAQVRYGIASSTGFQFNYHEIRNLRINTFDPIPPVAVDDLGNITAKNTPKEIKILDNDTDANGNNTIVPSSIVITVPPANGTVTKDALTGIVTYTPAVGYLGPDEFRYTVKDVDGAVSNVAKVQIQVSSIKPIGLPDAAITLINTPVTISVNANDPTKIDVIVIADTAPAGATVVINPDKTIKYTPPPGSVGTTTFTYRLRNGDGLESDPILVTVYVNSPPVANNDIEKTSLNQPVLIDLAGNDTDADGTVNKATVVIKSQPANGTLGPPDALGNITYTPNTGYLGADTFTYTIKDDKGTESNIATVTIAIALVPKIGVSKALVSVRTAISGTFVVRFKFTIGNYGKDPLERISLKDNLAVTFPGTEVKIVSVTPSGTLKVNPNYNGFSDTELLDPASTLAPDIKETVELILSLNLVSGEGTYQNNATGTAYSTLSGLQTTDQSVAGDKPDPNSDGDVSIFGPTFVEIKKGPLYIPEGFSPNGDGVNDFFVISHSQGKNINLDVYNRWGNRVYKSTAYKNDWDGRCTEGIFVGQDLPVGTYFYIIVIDNLDKSIGYITINK